MLPEISSFPLTQFYKQAVRDAVCGRVKHAVHGFFPPLVFLDIDCSANESIERECDSWWDQEEARLCVAVLGYLSSIAETLGQAQAVCDDVGVITLHRTQQCATQQVLQSSTGHHWPESIVHAASDCSGMQFETVILSTAQVHARHSLFKERLINLALTRARSLLIVVGRSKVLEQCMLWKAFINHVQSIQGAYQFVGSVAEARRVWALRSFSV